MLKKSKPIIGISTGDPNGIGIEVILKSLADKSILDLCCVVLFSNFELIESQIRFFNIDLNLKEVDDFDSLTTFRFKTQDELAIDFDVNTVDLIISNLTNYFTYSVYFDHQKPICNDRPEYELSLIHISEPTRPY